MATNPFMPVLGKEERILQEELSCGSVYFATDTRKIYLDVDGDHVKMPMGGNVNLFYGKMVLTVPPADGQVEFEFTMDDIERDEDNDVSSLLVPNVNDLILNSDGCFYKVIEVHGSGYDATLSAEKLTIAGTGGGGGGGSSDTPGSLASATMSRLFLPNGSATLYRNACPVQFAVKVTDDLGDAQTGNIGTYTVYINGIKQEELSGTAVGTVAEDPTNIKNITNVNEINTIDVGPYLPLGDSVEIKISVQTIYGPKTRTVSVAVTNMALTWDYNENSINIWDGSNTSLLLQGTVTGNVDKTVHIIINDTYHITLPTSRQNDWKYELKYAEMNLWHDAHKVEVYATATIGASSIPTPSIYKNVIIAKEKDYSTIISCNFFNRDIVQYNTVEIPIMVYNPKSLLNVITLFENSSEVDEWEEVPNKEVRTWTFTPSYHGTAVLSIQSGGTTKTLTLAIEKLNIDIEEDTDYALKFKASEFASDTNVQNWNSKGYHAQFTSVDGDPDRFDWVNGGLTTERLTDGTSRQYFCIKAGSKMTINYPLFYRDARQFGKCFKFIFKATKCKNYDGQILKCSDDNSGLTMRAQNAVFSYSGKEVLTSYCEDTYIEYELDIANNTKYIKTWLDGTPASFNIYSNESMRTGDNAFIEIGSNDCDVYVYLIKIYEKSLTDLKHLNNFIADAPNATEMMLRYERNDILDKDTNEISYSLLAEKNPNCYVHLYKMERMTRTKKDPVTCEYSQFHGSKTAVLNASNVTVKVQGTSSAAYGLAAFNLDSKFNDGFEDLVQNKHIDKWSMSPTAVPVNYFNTKVNVASCEGSNNAINAEWYNRYQPYQTVLRGRKKGAANTGRDCMEFIPGVVFIYDDNDQTDDQEYGGHGDNVFKDTPGYVDKPYYKMYSIGCMGNSKKNVDALHDKENPFECCIENNDNQLPGQKMVDVEGGYSINDTFYRVSIPSITKGETTLCPDGQYRDNRDLWEAAMDEIYGFRYPDGLDKVKALDPVYAERMITGWYDFVRWMASSNPQPAYERIYFTNGYYYIEFEDEEAFNEDSRVKYTYDKNTKVYTIATEYNASEEYYVELTAEEAFAARTDDIFQWADTNHTDYVLVSDDATLDPLHNDESSEEHAYFKKTIHVFGATNKLLETPYVMNGYTFKGYKAPDKIRATRDENSEVIAELGLSKYQEDYEPVLKGVTINTYNGTHRYDTYEYRMAKMLNECEKYLCMDSIVYHYLFIERHSMVDNVAKNTFWSTEDGLVWNLTKNYDNDTADGNDNQGKLSLRYGYEPGDTDEAGDSVFNAPGSVWLAFINGLYDACAAMYQHLDTKGAWSPTAYLQAHKDFQNVIPERCWIEDHYRKYVRPYEVYGSKMFVEMGNGGKKTHQRAQYETYQNYYISSKYFGSTCQSNNFVMRGESKNLKDVQFPITLYADCYVRGAYGSGKDKPNLSMRCKRNEIVQVASPIMDATDATIYLWPSNLYQSLGDRNTGLNEYQFTQFESVGAKKLRTLSLGVYSGKENNTLKEISFGANENLEQIYVAKYTKAEDLILTDSVGAEEIDARGSGFTTVELPKNAPLKTVLLEAPTTLTMSTLSNIERWSMDNKNLQTVRLEDIDRNPTPDLNSKTLIETADKLSEYRLKDVIWSESDPAKINVANSTIAILEKLLPLNTADNLDRVDALTGSLVIDGNAFNGTNEQALAIYETYAKAKNEYVRTLYASEEAFEDDERIKYVYQDGEYVPAEVWRATGTYYVQKLIAAYPNLDISFTGSNITLYNVNIYNGDGRIQWKRKTLPGSKITADFLYYGPNGSFTVADIQKSPSAEKEYIFLNKWIIKNDAGEIVDSEFNSEEPLWTGMINQNIHLYPQFDERPRSYSITVKMKHPVTKEVETIKATQDYVYGTPLKSIIPDGFSIYIDESNLELTQTYDLKGFSLVEDSETLVPASFTVTGEATLWAVIKLEDNIRNFVHKDNFAVYNNQTYTIGSYYEDAPAEWKNKEGVVLTPVSSDVRGKVTIPRTFDFNGTTYDVIGLAEFSKIAPNITHVFAEASKVESSLKVIDSYCFDANEASKNGLHYFDFDLFNVLIIKNGAFRKNTLLKNNTFGSMLEVVQGNAFQGSFDSEIMTINLPASLITISGSNAFAYLNTKPDTGRNVLNIGSPNQLSKLNLSLSSNTTAFTQNSEQKFATINFYSANYTSPEEIVGGKPLINYFTNGLLGDDLNINEPVTVQFYVGQ